MTYGGTEMDRTTVTQGRLSLAVGYQSPSQFGREYRRQFGVPPGEDAARPRRASRRR